MREEEEIWRVGVRGIGGLGGRGGLRVVRSVGRGRGVLEEGKEV